MSYFLYIATYKASTTLLKNRKRFDFIQENSTFKVYARPYEKADAYLLKLKEPHSFKILSELNEVFSALEQEVGSFLFIVSDSKHREGEMDFSLDSLDPEQALLCASDTIRMNEVYMFQPEVG